MLLSEFNNVIQEIGFMTRLPADFSMNARVPLKDFGPTADLFKNKTDIFEWSMGNINIVECKTFDIMGSQFGDERGYQVSEIYVNTSSLWKPVGFEKYISEVIKEERSPILFAGGDSDFTAVAVDEEPNPYEFNGCGHSGWTKVASGFKTEKAALLWYLKVFRFFYKYTIDLWNNPKLPDIITDYKLLKVEEDKKEFIRKNFNKFERRMLIDFTTLKAQYNVL